MGQRGLSWSHVLRFLKKLWHQSPAQAYRYVEERLGYLRERLFKNPSKLGPIDLERVVLLALENYDPKPYAGRVAIFCADTTSFAEMSGWRTVITGPVEIHHVPGAHLGMFFEPHVEDLVARLATSIEKVRQHERTSTSRNPA